MSLEKLKTNLLALEVESEEDELFAVAPQSQIEVLCDSIRQALLIGSKELGVSTDQLDYEVLRKGYPGFLGVGKIPYQILVSISEDIDENYKNIEGMENSLGQTKDELEKENVELPLNRDGRTLVRIYKTGVYLIVKPPVGSGIPVDIHTAKDKISRVGIDAYAYDEETVKEVVKKRTGEFVKISDWAPKPDADSTVSVEVVPDEMLVYINISAPRPGGRHLTIDEVIQALKHFGVVFGLQEDQIQTALEEEKYGQQILAAKGTSPENGKDAYVEYKVKIDKAVEFKQDSQGRVDYLAKGIIENVVQGQLLARLMPPTKGKPGQSTTGKLTLAKDGKNKDLLQGKGTILSKDGKSLTAEKNGQIVYAAGRINVEEVFVVAGDIGLNSGNVIFLGSIVVHGLVSDNMQLKAGGNIEIGGNVQKAQIEAEGNIIIKGGIQGRDEGKMESTGGSVFAKFIQNTSIIAEKDVITSEAIMHSNVQAVGSIVCSGRRAQIVGGEILAGVEVRVKQLGSQASTPTKVVVGINPKIFNQQREIEVLEEDSIKKLEKAKQNIRTLNNQKISMDGELTEDKNEMLVRMMDAQEKLQTQLKEFEEEKQQLDEYISELSMTGAVHVEKTLYPGVSIEINGAVFLAKDEYHRISLIEERGSIKIIPFVSEKQKDWRKRSIT